MKNIVRTIARNWALACVKQTVGLVLIVCAFIILDATAPVEKLDRSGSVECWNEHTAQISIVSGDACPVPANPYK